MENNQIKIFIDRLANEGDFQQNGELDASVLGLKKDDALSGNILYNLKAYLADEHLVLNFDASCQLKLPCTVCNEFTSYNIDLKKQSALEPLNEVKKGVYDASQCIRDAILLQVPPYYECQGNCPERESIKKYLKAAHTDNESYNPFQNL